MIRHNRTSVRGILMAQYDVATPLAVDDITQPPQGLREFAAGDDGKLAHYS
jgi:hypothetical protein